MKAPRAPGADRAPGRALPRRLARLLPSLLLIAAAIAAWQAVTVLRNVPDYILPAPSQIWQAAVDERALLWQNTIPTLEIAVGGFLLALALGLVLAILIRSSRTLETAVYPIIIVSQTVPILALAPLLIVILGFTIFPKIVIVCLICFFSITVNTVDGLKSVDPEMVNLLRTLGAGRWQRFRWVEWPAALPYLFSGARVAITYSVVGAVFGEWVGSSEGLGWYMLQARDQFDVPGVFAAGTILTVMGIVLFAAVTLVERLAVPWSAAERRRPARQR